MQLSREIFQKIRHIQVQTNRLVNALLVGVYKSAFKGRGIEFEEARPYQTGDDIRAIDWNVTARMSHPYVKNFREERQLTMMLVVDISASLRFGTPEKEKRQILAEVAAAFAFAAIKNQDKVGLILFSDIIEKYIPPNRGTRHVLRVIRELLAFEPKQKGTNIGDALRFFGKVQPKSSICFLMSDFMSSENITHDIKLLSKKHDLIAVKITDPREMEFPPLPLAYVQDLETGKSAYVDSAEDAFQNEFQLRMKSRNLNIRDTIRKAGADFLELRTDQSYGPVIRNFFQRRVKRQ
jgi:uncharacterized protein (DUF58 family)